MAEHYSEQNQMVLSLLAIAALIFSAIIYARISMASHGYLDKNYTDINGDLNEGNGTASMIEENNKSVSFKKKITFSAQPSCPLENKHDQLNILCAQIIFEKYSCKPEDVLNPMKHKIPKFYYQNVVKNNSNEAQNTIVDFIIAALLLTSLGAALLEFYRAKIGPSRPDDKKGAKGNLSRKCSLAELTVLKHQRKELVRRESVLEQHPEEGGHGSSQKGPKPLLRRCSFPVSFPANKDSLGGTGGGPIHIRRNSRGGMPILEGGRKLSIVADENAWRRGSLVGGENCSPERRVHHSRLVHRH